MPRISKEAAEKLKSLKSGVTTELAALDCLVVSVKEVSPSQAEKLQKIVAKLEKWQQK